MFADMFVLGLADMIHEWKLKHMGCLYSDNKHFQIQEMQLTRSHLAEKVTVAGTFFSKQQLHFVATIETQKISTLARNRICLNSDIQFNQ